MDLQTAGCTVGPEALTAHPSGSIVVHDSDRGCGSVGDSVDTGLSGRPALMGGGNVGVGAGTAPRA
jgi:hypothetical protein